MVASASPQWPKLPAGSGYVDTPAPGAEIYATTIPVSGWLWLRDRDPARCCVTCWIDGARIASTRTLSHRDDVARALELESPARVAFRMLGSVHGVVEQPRLAVLTVTARWGDENEPEHELAKFTVRLLPARLSQRPYGDVLHPEQGNLLHRENIYGSGPPIAEPGRETLELIRGFLERNDSVVDVGCGAGAYGRALIDAGHPWLGLEVNQTCLNRLDAAGLPRRQVDPQADRLPCDDAEFDAAICIEVLEHIAEPDVFLRELARIIRARALFSVPNMEVIPYFSAWQVVPWHLLEGDHRNFFTRGSLRALLSRHFSHVEVFSYAEHPLRTPEDLPLHVHLFAVAHR